MAVNDSLFMYTNGEARALLLKNLNDKYYIDEVAKQIKKRSDNTPVAPIEGVSFGSRLRQDFITEFNELCNDILEYDYYSCAPFEGEQGERLPNPPQYYIDRGAFFKMTDKDGGGKNYYWSLTPRVVDATDPFDFWAVYPWRNWGVTSEQAKTTYASGWEGYESTNKQSDLRGGVGLINSADGVANIIFVNKYGDENTFAYITNNELMTAEMKTWHKDKGIKSLYFNLVDSANFQYGEEATPAGYSGGSWDDSSDDIGVPSDPTFDFVQQGSGKFYKITSMSNVLDELFPELDFDTDNVAKMLKNLVEIQQSDSLKRYIIDVYAIPVQPVLGSSIPIKVGWKSLTQNAPVVSKQWVTVSCGRYNLKEYYSNFLDYEGTEVKLYLPFVGFVDIATEFIVSGSIEVVYKFDCVSGEFMCYVLSDSGKSNLNSVIATYSGSAITHLPINTIDYKSQLNGIIGGASKVMGGAMEIGAKDYAKGIENIASGSLQALTSRPTPSLSNSYTGSSALMSIRYPFFLISRAVGQFSASYRQEIGLPLNVSKRLGDLQGFTVCQIDDVAIEEATQEEREQIVSLLRSGIIL